MTRFQASRLWPFRRSRSAALRPAGDRVDDIRLGELIAARGPWHHRYEIRPGCVTPGSYDPGFMWEKLGLPDDLSGARVLDLGCSDGFFVKKLIEARADVFAVDILDKSRTGLGVLETVLGQEIPFLRANIFDLPGHRLGTFDYVLCLGLIYHLPDMCRGLDIVRGLCRGVAFVESHVETVLVDQSVATYHRGNRLNGDLTNFWSPTLLCLREMLEDAGFDVLEQHSWGDRALVSARSHPDRSVKYSLAYKQT